MSATAIKERPIIFGPDSVRAILAWRKSQSRRVVKPQPPAEVDWRFARECAGWYEFEEVYRPYAALAKWSTRCPYGKPGQRLWVREAWWNLGRWVERGYHQEPPDWPEAYAWSGIGPHRDRLLTPGQLADYRARGVRYAADDPALDGEKTTLYWGKRSPIYMPRWASRLTLELTGVRVERLLEIGREDCEAELGLEPWTGDGPEPYERDLGALFCIAWDKINARRGYPWSSNPYVWCLEFKRVEGES